MAGENLLKDLIATTHYAHPEWNGMDQIPDRDGAPGWDTPESGDDPDDEEDEEPEHYSLADCQALVARYDADFERLHPRGDTGVFVDKGGDQSGAGGKSSSPEVQKGVDEFKKLLASGNKPAIAKRFFEIQAKAARERGDEAAAQQSERALKAAGGLEEREKRIKAAGGPLKPGEASPAKWGPEPRLENPAGVKDFPTAAKTRLGSAPAKTMLAPEPPKLPTDNPDVRDHSFGIADAAKEENWHREYIKDRWGLDLHLGLKEVAKAIRFVTGLLNGDLVGSVTKLVDWAKGKKPPEPAVVKAVLPKLDALRPGRDNEPVAKITAGTFGKAAPALLDQLQTKEGRTNRKQKLDRANEQLKAAKPEQVRAILKDLGAPAEIQTKANEPAPKGASGQEYGSVGERWMEQQRRRIHSVERGKHGGFLGRKQKNEAEGTPERGLFEGNGPSRYSLEECAAIVRYAKDASGHEHDAEGLFIGGGGKDKPAEKKPEGDHFKTALAAYEGAANPDTDIEAGIAAVKKLPPEEIVKLGKAMGFVGPAAYLKRYIPQAIEARAGSFKRAQMIPESDIGKAKRAKKESADSSGVRRYGRAECQRIAESVT